LFGKYPFLGIFALFRINLNKTIAMINVSESAKNQVERLLSDGSNAPGSFIRVGVKSGGCSGLSYDLKFDTDLKPEDKVFEDNGVKIVVDKKSLLYLAGTTLEFEGGLNGKGFNFNNPNASRTCGCGESFAV
jgi:iron-sulfur cluster assembly protein